MFGFTVRAVATLTLVSVLTAGTALGQCPHSRPPAAPPGGMPPTIRPAPQPAPEPVFFHVYYWHPGADGKPVKCLYRGADKQPVRFASWKEAWDAAQQLEARYSYRTAVEQAYWHVVYWHTVETGRVEECLLRDKAGEVVCFTTRSKAIAAAQALNQKYGYKVEVRLSDQ